MPEVTKHALGSFSMVPKQQRTRYLMGFTVLLLALSFLWQVILGRCPVP